MAVDIKFTDNSDKVKQEFEAAILEALEAIGQTVEGRAADYAPVDTGRLRDSITHEVADDEHAVYIGVPQEVDYGKYQELGTSKMPAHPFLKPAVIDSIPDMKRIVEGGLKDDVSIWAAIKQGWKEGTATGKKVGKKIEKGINKMGK